MAKTLLVTADLHYGNRREGDACTRALAEFACEQDADALVVAGDVAERDPAGFRTCLELFDAFPGPRMVVPGNHDVWRDGAGSREKLEDLLPRQAREAGFHMLDTGPLVVGDTGFVGSIGWYDYSLRNVDLGLTTQQYEAKRVRGLATWNDLHFVDWPWSDREFTDRCLARLERHRGQVADRADRLVAVIHHLPFRELLYGPAAPPYEFCRAYMGSVRFGEMFFGWPALQHVLCGHRHGYDHLRTPELDAWCVGSEYGRKRLLRLDLDSGEYEVYLFSRASDGTVTRTHENG